jgi:hypothetical protein
MKVGGERVRGLDEGGDLEQGLSKSYYNREQSTCLPRSGLLNSKLLGSSTCSQVDDSLSMWTPPNIPDNGSGFCENRVRKTWKSAVNYGHSQQHLFNFHLIPRTAVRNGVSK